MVPNHTTVHPNMSVTVFVSSILQVEARSVQICTNLQPDYDMKYCRMQVVQTVSSVIKHCDRPGISRRQQRECQAHGSTCLSLKLPLAAGLSVDGRAPARARHHAPSSERFERDRLQPRLWRLPPHAV